MKFPALPVRSAHDATLNFDVLQRLQNTVAIAYSKTNQTINGEVKIKLDVVTKDVGGNVDTTNNLYRCPSDGVYLVTGVIGFKIKAANVLTIAYMKRSGVKVLEGERGYNTTNGAYYQNVVTGLLVCARGDTLELFGYTEGGEAETLTSTGAINQLCVVRVA